MNSKGGTRSGGDLWAIGEAKLRLHSAANEAERAIYREALKRLGVPQIEIAQVERGAEIVRGKR